MQLSAYGEMHGAHYSCLFFHNYALFSTALLHISYNQLIWCILRNINVRWTFHFNLCSFIYAHHPRQSLFMTQQHSLLSLMILRLFIHQYGVFVWKSACLCSWKNSGFIMLFFLLLQFVNSKHKSSKLALIAYFPPLRKLKMRKNCGHK